MRAEYKARLYVALNTQTCHRFCLYICLHLRILDEHFEEQLNEVIRLCPKSRQTMLFSATMTDQVMRRDPNFPLRLVAVCFLLLLLLLFSLSLSFHILHSHMHTSHTRWRNLLV